MGLDSDEKALIMAAAVLGTILFSIIAFAVLYRTFLAQYAQAYNKQMAMMNMPPGGMVTTSNPAYKDPVPQRSPTGFANYMNPDAMSPGTPASQAAMPKTQIKLSDPPKKAVTVKPMIGVAAPKAESPPKSVTWGTTTVQDPLESGVTSSNATKAPENDWGSENATNEFFSADEQAKIWAELREAEEQHSGAPSGAEVARSKATEGAAIADDDHDTQFGFGDDDAVDYISPGEGNYNASQGLGVDYISPDSLVQTGETFDPSDHIHAVKMVRVDERVTSLCNSFTSTGCMICSQWSGFVILTPTLLKNTKECI
eukprot:m.114026 g.114026  ORF g.114026 m.114026 type:complete len:313 (+) comp17115_c0_seq2:232-1170(+)